MFLALCTILILLNRPEVRRISGAVEYIAEERSKLGPFSKGERNTLIAFAFAVSLWVLPGLTALIFGDESPAYSIIYSRLDEGTVAIIGAALLFLLPINWSERRFTMNWNQAARIDWGTIILFGCGIALGTLLSDTGLAETYRHRDSQRPRLHQPGGGLGGLRAHRHHHLRNHLQHSVAPPSSCRSSSR